MVDATARERPIKDTRRDPALAHRNLGLASTDRSRARLVDVTTVFPVDSRWTETCAAGVFWSVDIMGDKPMEINVLGPGGLGSAQKVEHVKFSHLGIEALERKVDHNRYHRRNFDDIELAML